LKCAHLITAKAPLPEEAIFNQNKAAAEKRRAARKAQYKKRQIAKRDRNDNRIKRRKVQINLRAVSVHIKRWRLSRSIVLTNKNEKSWRSRGEEEEDRTKAQHPL
jgi:hypothetical protein